ncbi:MAG: efflux RND transporter permease subunit, partial [Myxococcota bacterium]|nr:efflux RND transporter permease subunit [Myxococcota bacterium]
SLTTWDDDARVLRGRIDTLVRNARSGLLLVLLSLALFLKPRLAFWVSAGIPIAFLGALWTMPAADVSLNVVSLFAFILVLGILVDDAIVVGENIYTHQRNREDPLSAAIAGTREVGVPVVFGVLTTVAAFMPLILVEGTMGQIFGVIGLVVILCLAASLVEALLILPAHLGHGIPADAPGRTRAGSGWTGFQERFASGLERLIAGPYRRGLAWALSWRYLTLALGVSALICTLAVVASGRLRFSFFPSLQADFVIASLTMAQGTPYDVTAEAVEEIAAAGRRLQAELDAEWGGDRSLIQHALVSIGDHPTQNSNQNPGNAGQQTASAGHLGEVTLELVPAEERAISTEEIAQRWRELVPPIPGQEELVFQSSFFSAGEAVNVRLRGPNVDELEAAADRVKALLAGYTGVYDITDSFRAGKREAKLTIRPAGEALGVTQRDLARQVRQAFYGEEAQRVQRGRDDVAVMVRYPAHSRRSLGDLENLRIRTAAGSEVPFYTVAAVEMGRGYSTIRRTNRQRIVSVTAEVDRTLITGNEVLAQITAGPLQEIVGDYEGMSFFFAGAQEEQRRALGGLARWFVVALFAIYALLAVPLRSYVQPLLIMSVIPFGTVGAILGHLLMAAFKPGFGLSFMSVMGIVALTGVVVNGSLVLIYSLNGHVARGVPLPEAVARASEGRFRPIVLTSITTFVGLTPLLLEQSLQAQFLIPMATSLAFGVLLATLITLFLLPAGILVLDDFSDLPARIRGWRARRRAGGFEGAEGEAIQVPVGGGR